MNYSTNLYDDLRTCPYSCDCTSTTANSLVTSILPSCHNQSSPTTQISRRFPDFFVTLGLSPDFSLTAAVIPTFTGFRKFQKSGKRASTGPAEGLSLKRPSTMLRPPNRQQQQQVPKAGGRSMRRVGDAE